MTKNIKEKLGEFARLSINSINGALKYKGFKVKKTFWKDKSVWEQSTLKDHNKFKSSEMF